MAGVQEATPATGTTSAVPLQPGTATYVELESSCRNSTAPPGVTPVLDWSTTVAWTVKGTPTTDSPAANEGEVKVTDVPVAAGVTARAILGVVALVAELLVVDCTSPL